MLSLFVNETLKVRYFIVSVYYIVYLSHTHTHTHTHTYIMLVYVVLSYNI